MIRFRADTEKWAPVAVECAVRGWPEVDADGQTQFDNSHFDTEEEAWAKLRSEAEAALHLDADRVMRLRAELAHAEKHLVDAALIREQLLYQRDHVTPVDPESAGAARVA